MKKQKGGYLDSDDQDELDHHSDEGVDDDFDNQDMAQKMSNGVLEDMKELQRMENEVPNTHKEKDLRACIRCKLILSE